MKRSDCRQAEPDLFERAETIPHSTALLKFKGTDNCRELRALHALLLRPIPREQLDRIVGCSNGPDLIFRIRALGLPKENGLVCTMVPDYDRDGYAIRRGVYSLSDAGRRAVNRWLRKRNGGG